MILLSSRCRSISARQLYLKIWSIYDYGASTRMLWMMSTKRMLQRVGQSKENALQACFSTLPENRRDRVCRDCTTRLKYSDLLLTPSVLSFWKSWGQCFQKSITYFHSLTIFLMASFLASKSISSSSLRYKSHKNSNISFVSNTVSLNKRQGTSCCIFLRFYSSSWALILNTICGTFAKCKTLVTVYSRNRFCSTTTTRGQSAVTL